VRWRCTKKIATEDRPEVAANPHDDDEIRLDRLESFANALAPVQLHVLGQLRSSSDDQEAALLPAVEAIAIARSLPCS